MINKKMEELRLYNGKWDGIWDKPKYQRIREKIWKSFEGIEFIEETHQYFYKGKELIPTSNICHLFRHPFDEDYMAESCAIKYSGVEGHKYYGMTKEEIIDSWHQNSKRATDHGTLMHLFGENCAYFMMRQYDRLTDDFKARIVKDDDGREYVVPKEPKEEAIVNFWNDLPVSIIPIVFEIQMFSLKYNVSGTAELLFLHDPHIEQEDNDEEIMNRLYLMDYKGLPLDTPILTANEGWKTMETIKVGDLVYDKNGEQVKVLHTSEIHYNPCYKINFNNGESIVADCDHRWEISLRRQNKKFLEKVMTTQEIFNYLKNIKRETYYIPKIKIAKPINNKNIDLPIDPYVLGVWLGDGNSYSGHVTNMYKELWDEIEKRGYKLGNDVSQGSSGKAQTRNIVGLSTELKKLNLLKNKHLPQIYLLASFSQRLDVLRGLMDTDGYYHKKRNRFVMCTTKKWQRDAMVNLLSSLGIKATVLKIISKCSNCPHEKVFEKFDITFYTKETPFLIRKITPCLKKNNRYTYRTITSVEKTDTVPTRCIEVSGETHTYLCGDNLLVTHNTNADLYKYYNNMLEPFEELPDNDLGGYKIQAAIYSGFLMSIGFNFVARALIWLKEDGTYEKVKMESLTQILRDYLETHPIPQLIQEREKH